MSEKYTKHSLNRLNNPPIHDRKSMPSMLEHGLLCLGLPREEADSLRSSLLRGELPSDIINAVRDSWQKIRELPSDKYPNYLGEAHDAIYSQLQRTPNDTMSVDTISIWHGIRSFLKTNKMQEALEFYSKEKNPAEAICNILRDYGLTRCDIQELSRTEAFL